MFEKGLQCSCCFVTGRGTEGTAWVPVRALLPGGISDTGLLRGPGMASSTASALTLALGRKSDGMRRPQDPARCKSRTAAPGAPRRWVVQTPASCTLREMAGSVLRSTLSRWLKTAHTLESQGPAQTPSRPQRVAAVGHQARSHLPFPSLSLSLMLAGGVSVWRSGGARSYPGPASPAQ